MKLLRFLPIPAALLLALPAAASSVMSLDLPQLAQLSHTVVRAQVKGSAARWSADRSRIVTDVELQVLETWKGEAKPSLVVLQPGGVIGEVGQRVHGLPSFQAGEEVVVFLERRGSERFIVTGMAQGKWRIEPATDGKGAMAVPDPEAAGLRTVDPATGQETTKRREAMAFERFEALVRGALAPTQPSTPTTPGTRPLPVTPKATTTP